MSTNGAGLPVPTELLPYLLGQKHDYTTITDSIYQFNIIFIIVVTVAVTLRMYVRFNLIRAAGPDDSM